MNLAIVIAFVSIAWLYSKFGGWFILLAIPLIPLVMIWLPFIIFSFIVYSVAALIILTYLILYPLEVFLRRIAEYPSGPILAVSALATATGGFLDFFSP